jgi:oligoribonuclease NrnB/cAMP/cGMP phosphodiesterase (DHH superfamily)
MIVFHHNDADGRCSAAIVKFWFDHPSDEHPRVHDGTGRIEFVEMDYKNRVPVEKIGRDDLVVIVDFSFRPGDMAAVQAATDIGVVWCDHHKTAEAYGYDVPGIRDFTEKGMAGCECTWKFFFPGEKRPNWIRVLGDYDAWRMQEKDLCLPFHEGLKLEDQSPAGLWNVWERLFEDTLDSMANKIVEQGWSAIKYRDNYCAELRTAFGYATEIDGHKAYALNTQRFGSQGFGEKFAEYPVCIAFVFDGQKFTVSLYSETVDVSVIAKRYGGGGHKGAAGFTCYSIPWGA